ncbi:MAG TPA: UDP-N-acetylmuramate--L-alanine ligase [Abditibacteriaceae bacterium]|jgi:UDP-N-acetylmuramate--alanine ligase
MRWRDFDKLPPLPPEFFHIPRRVHFIGIGGIGMSALAFVLASRGHAISGSDVKESDTLKQLREAGAKIAIGQREENLDLAGAPCDAVIFSSAVAPDNPERVEAEKRNVPLWHRAQLLAYFVNTAKKSIAVSGTHGKSTTSAMVAHILTECGHDPTAILGAVYPPFGSNARIGDPDLVVVEADESDGSFTLLHPTVSVILNVEAEHLENYDDSEERLWEAFAMFVKQAREEVVLNEEDAELTQRLGDDNSILYTTTAAVNSAVWASHLKPESGKTGYGLCYAGFRFPATDDSDFVGEFSLGVPGLHNVSNALAAITSVWPLEVLLEDSAKALQSFHGTLRRFERKGEASGVLIYDDYGHHPTEVEKTLQAAKEFLNRRLLVIFQPHRYSRTQQLGAAFGPAFGAADEVIITQLYSAFEEPIEGVSGKIVYDAVQNSYPEKPVYYAETLAEAKRLALDKARPGDVILTMGAGDITTLGPQLLDALKSQS